MAEGPGSRVHEKWAHLRFAVIGWLLAAPPEKGALKAAIADLASRTWQHPTSDKPVRFGFSTIERWYYRALRERTDPVGVLRRKVRTNAGQQHTIGDALKQALIAQYAAHKSWSVQLHYDNLVALTLTQPDLLPLPSYTTLRRFMKASGMIRRQRLTPRRTDSGRLIERLRSDELAPLGSRMRVRLALDRATPQELAEMVEHTLRSAGAPKLMTPELVATLCDHAQGNPRALMNIAAELLDVAAQREVRHIDEKLFLEMCAAPPAPEPKTARARR